MSGIVVDKNQILVVVDKRERKILYKNQNLIFDNKKRSYQIEEDRGVVFKKDSTKYYELLLSVKIPKNKKYNDVLEFSIQEEKRRINKMIKVIWEGD